MESSSEEQVSAALKHSEFPTPSFVSFIPRCLLLQFASIPTKIDREVRPHATSTVDLLLFSKWVFTMKFRIRSISCLLAFSTLCSLSFAQDATKKEPLSTTASHGTIKVDGEVDDAWKDVQEVEVKKVVKSETSMAEAELATGKVKVMWDQDNLYALWEVKDAKLSAKASDAWAQDSIELFVDELNERAGSYQKDDAQYRVSFEGKISGDGAGYKADNIKAVAKKTETGYRVEMSVKLSHAKKEAGTKMGLELQINDDPGTGSRGGISKWNHPENDSYMSTSDFGTVVLK